MPNENRESTEDRHLKRQVEYIRDTDSSAVHEVIVRMRPTGQDDDAMLMQLSRKPCVVGDFRRPREMCCRSHRKLLRPRGTAAARDGPTYAISRQKTAVWQRQ